MPQRPLGGPRCVPSGCCCGHGLQLSFRSLPSTAFIDAHVPVVSLALGLSLGLVAPVLLVLARATAQQCVPGPVSSNDLAPRLWLHLAVGFLWTALDC